MSEVSKILLTSSITVVAGVLVFVLGQIFQKFYLDPIHELANVIGEILYTLEFYAREPSAGASDSRFKDTAFAPEELKTAALAFRQCASKLYASTNAIHGHGFFRLLRYVPPRTALDAAKRLLIGLSNFSGGEQWRNDENADKIKRLLSHRLPRGSARL